MRFINIYIIILIILSIQFASGDIFAQPGNIESVKYDQFVITSASPIEFYPSDIRVINITIKNIFGYSAFGVSTVIDPNKADPIKFTHELQKYISSEIGPNQNVTIPYEIYIKDDVPKGTYYIPLTLLWSTVKDGIVKRQEDLFIGIKVAENPEVIKIDTANITTIPEHIKAGDSFKVIVLLKNSGNNKINTIRASIKTELPFVSQSSGTEKYINSLDPDQSSEIEFAFLVDKLAMSRVYNFNLTIEYKDFFNKWVGQQSNFGILIEELPQVYIHDIIIDPPILELGDKGLLSMQLTNAGTNEIKNVRFNIKGGDGILVQKENFIGQISPKKTESLSYGIYVDPSLKLGDYGFGMYITYDDANGITHQYSYLYPVSIVSIPLLPIASNTFLAIAAGFLFLIFSYIVLLIKGKKIKKKIKE